MEKNKKILCQRNKPKICRIKTRNPNKRKCNEYRNLPGASPQVCSSLQVTDSTKKRCAYNSDNGNCYEEYASCQAYTENEIEKTRAACQSIQLADPNKECVYIKEEDICMERTIYTS